MKNKFVLPLWIIFFGFCFIVLFNSLKNSNIYIPEENFETELINFNSKDFFSGKRISSKDVFVGSDYYILNIWASWCAPCREEHPKLMELSKNSSIKIIGLNYKDNLKNAKKFINNFGNPYSSILLDHDGIISIELGAYGIPETFIINKKKKIIKKFRGVLNTKRIKEINLILK